ncbi:IDEAL domain-containing protein [Bacillus cihuensis]|uniref:IDEAL domain-containing protein n=1 Tax=Bacillus cihuensis TaxID=1208599 RepID=UPI000426AC82|nr:IDEAL domain-containing protein [Bacillus cihuensis]
MEKQLPRTLLEPEVTAEMILERAILDFRKKTIEKAIDHSLKTRNKEEFIRLTEELKNIN